jgi:prepilin-type N-terminal cleavage/methylation domain-containing protein
MRMRGFTLSELLIALAILGVIAAFTIPKVLQSQQDKRFNAIAKETAGMITGAYDAYRLNNAVTATTRPADLTPFMNYVRVDTASIIDYYPGGSSSNCSADQCLKLHNGAVLWYLSGVSFGGTANINALYFQVDPDGRYCGGTSCEGKAVRFFLYYNGRLSNYGAISSGTVSSDATRNPDPTRDPSWFSWE